MFIKHNIFTTLLFICVLANGALALFNSQNIISGLINFSTWEETVYWLVSLVAICVSIYGGILVFQKKRVGLAVCLGVYAIQLFGVITSSYNYIIIVGLYVSWSLDLGILFNLEASSVDMNLVALIIVILSGISLSTISKIQQRENCT